ncbi:glycosyltransferase [Pseudactinotalea terrae]|uniref:glycosyltransferase n=1 Tax=Pseudactinotalea terrae TaxID=1743262 RepID=UPI001391F171
MAVTYNSGAVIEEFLHALRDALDGAPAANVVIVDNDSSDGTPELVRTLAPWATLIDAGANVGYAAGINVALRSVTPRLGAYILNPDAVPAAGSVRLLLEPTLADASLGITVPRMRTADGSLFYSLRREPTILRALGEAILGGSRAGRHVALGEVVNDEASYAEPTTAAWATGAAMFLHRRTLDTVGLWDERFFLYSEETDYALRARDAGLALRYVPEAEVRHLGGDLGTSDGLWSLMTHNRVRLYRKRHGPVASACFWFAVTLGELVRAAAGKRRSRAALRVLLSGGRQTQVDKARGVN